MMFRMRRGGVLMRGSDREGALHARRDLYADWARQYPPYPHNPLMEAEQAAVLELLPPVAGRTVLDAGCGTGRYLRILQLLGARALGVDRSQAMVARAHRIGMPVIRGDMAALPVGSGSCTLVVSALAILDVDDLRAVVQEWARVLTPHGVAVFSTLHPDGEALGWTRTFHSGRTTRMLPTRWHSIEDQHAACAYAGLTIDAVREPRLAATPAPVAVVVRARRSG
jgi:malonyl-CoA O-methyltransferase